MSVWRAVIVLFVVLCVEARSARAEPWYRGRHGTNRVVHLSLTIGAGALYPATAFLEARWSPTECNAWCDPPAIDRAVRNGLAWDDDRAPRLASHVMSFAIAPAVASWLVLAYTPPTSADLIDNLVPLAESTVVTLWITRAIKLGVGRQRPYAHYGAPEDTEDNLSFPSGHTSRAFAVGVAAAVIAHQRGYPSEKYIWASTAVIGLTTGYLRIAADKHYFTDVMVGAAIGTGVGLTVPLLMKRDLEVLPAPGGIAVAGAW